MYVNGYRMQHVYWIANALGTDQDHIKRAKLNGTANQTPEIVLFPLDEPGMIMALSHELSVNISLFL